MAKHCTTAELVRTWRIYTENAGDPTIIRALELELFHRPVKERMEAGYPK